MLIACIASASAGIGSAIVMHDMGSVDLIPAKFTADNNTAMLFTDWGDEELTGKIYSKDMQLVKTIIATNGPAITATMYYQYKYDENSWSEVNEEQDTNAPSVTSMNHLTEASSDTYDLYFTQHLFNNDDLYEYIVPTFTKENFSVENEYEKRWGEIIRINGFTVMNENGSTLASVEFPTGYCTYSDNYLDINLLDLGDVYYLLIENVVNDSDEYFTLVYKLDKETSRVLSVGEPILTRVSPKMPEAGTPVNVELGCVANANTRVSVVSDAGQTIMSKAVKTGEQSTTISTAGLRKGMYVVVVSDGTSKHESTKIIIR